MEYTNFTWVDKEGKITKSNKKSAENAVELWKTLHGYSPVKRTAKA